MGTIERRRVQGCSGSGGLEKSNMAGGEHQKKRRDSVEVKGNERGKTERRLRAVRR